MRAPDPDVRVSDHDRQEVVAQLSKHTGEGRLTLAEFEARVDEVWHATKQGELRHTLRELPAPPAPRPARQPAGGASPLMWFVAFLAIMFALALLVGKWIIWVAVAVWFVRGGPSHHRRHHHREAVGRRREQLTHV